MELVAQDLACRRAGRSIFRGLGFAVGAGAAVALRGPNGAGKSSLLRVLAGLSPLAAGTVRLGDLDLARDGEAWREQVAFAGHLDAVKPALSVRENLTCWADFHGAPRARADAALDRFGLSGRADDPAHWCSAGQKRRLGLARLLIVDRPVWLLDEPTVSLDAASVAVFAQVVAEHCAAGGLALAATHVDLGFGDGAEVVMPAPGAALETVAAPSADPFLGEDWG